MERTPLDVVTFDIMTGRVFLTIGDQAVELSVDEALEIAEKLIVAARDAANLARVN